MELLKKLQKKLEGNLIATVNRGFLAYGNYISDDDLGRMRHKYPLFSKQEFGYMAV